MSEKIELYDWTIFSVERIVYIHLRSCTRTNKIRKALSKELNLMYSGIATLMDTTDDYRIELHLSRFVKSEAAVLTRIIEIIEPIEGSNFKVEGIGG